MKLLLLLSLIILALVDGALVAEKIVENNDVFSQAVLQSSVQEGLGQKKLEKRSLLPVAYKGTSVLPWYRLGRLSSYGLYDYDYGWYPGWSLYGGWYKGW